MDRLIERARRGDAEALEALLASVAPSVHRFGLRMCRDVHDAEDVLQDTLLAIATHLGEFEGRSSVSSWAFALARSACTRRRRGLKNRPLEGEEAALAAASAAPTPEELAADQELSRALASALDELPEEQREVVLLRDVEGLSAPEAAASLGISVAALKSRLHRARTALRDVLRPILEPSAPPPGKGCPDVLALWSSKLEGDLSRQDCSDMEHHMEGCPSCASACNALKRALWACQSSATPEVAPEVQTRIKAALSAWKALPAG